MTPLLAQQRRLLAEQVRVLRRLAAGLGWSLQHLPDVANFSVDDPASAERVAAIVDRFCKLQDQLAGAMRHAHSTLGERQRNFQDVVVWAVCEGLLPDAATWLELRSLRNRLTHEYDLAAEDLPELLSLIRQQTATLSATCDAFIAACTRYGLIEPVTRLP